MRFLFRTSFVSVPVLLLRSEERVCNGLQLLFINNLLNVLIGMLVEFCKRVAFWSFMNFLFYFFAPFELRICYSFFAMVVRDNVEDRCR
jgi:hypothetical protein